MPATGSICSNIPGHKNPNHFVSTGSPQKLVDHIIQGLLEHASTASELCRERYGKWIERLEEEIAQLESKIPTVNNVNNVNNEDDGIDVISETDDIPRHHVNGNDVDMDAWTEEVSHHKGEFIDERTDDLTHPPPPSVYTPISNDNSPDEYNLFWNDDELRNFAKKRKSESDTTPFPKRRKFDEHSVDSDHESDVDSFLDTGSVLELQDCEVDNEIPPSNELMKKKLNKYKTLLSKLTTYCDQLVVIGFNSQRYDIPLIKEYLPSSLRKFDSIPRFVIKKSGGYMVIASKKLKFLDLTND